MAEMSMFCTEGLRLFGLRGCILREKMASRSASFLWGSTRQLSATARGSVRCAGHAPAKQSAAAKMPRHRARQACCGETTPRNAAMHLYAMDEGMRASDTRQCRICCYLTKSEKEEEGLQRLFDRAALGGKKRRSTRGQRGRYPARAAAHLSLPSNIMASVAALSRLTPPGQGMLNLCTGSAGTSGGRQEG